MLEPALFSVRKKEPPPRCYRFAGLKGSVNNTSGSTTAGAYAQQVHKYPHMLNILKLTDALLISLMIITINITI